MVVPIMEITYFDFNGKNKVDIDVIFNLLTMSTLILFGLFIACKMTEISIQ